MSKKAPRFEIRERPQEVMEFAKTVRTHADSHRDALGFLVAPAYEEAARKGTLFVAVQSSPTGDRYAGHILFGDAYPHAKIHQVFVVPNARKFGVGRKLIETVVQFAESKQYLSVSAKVAADLPANDFWQAIGFETFRTKPGGVSRGRTINIRVRQLNTPALFGYREPVSGLPLSEPLPTFTPVFAIDLNVFFDVVRRRPRSEQGGVVMSASFNNLIRLAVTEEFSNELKRTSVGSGDPVLEFALQIPKLPTPQGGMDQKILEELAKLTFPQRAEAGSLTTQDRSDLIHLAIAAHHKVTGFVTAEDALVKASTAIEERFGIRVVHVADLAQVLRTSTVTSTPLKIGFAEGDLSLSDAELLDTASLKLLANSLRLPNDVRQMVLATGIHAGLRRSLSISLGTEIVCAAFWPANSTLRGTLETVVLVDEEQASAEVALDALFNRLSRMSRSPGPIRIQLMIPNACLTAQRVALRCGFIRCNDLTPELSHFQRLSIGGVISTTSWTDVRRELSATAHMKFPADLPVFAGNDARIQFEDEHGKEFVIDLYDLETALSPTLFLLPNRPAVLVPIRAGYADELLGTSNQEKLFPKRQAVVLHERTYFSSTRNLNILRRGTPIVFYESSNSNGRGAAIALARVRSTEVVPKQQVARALLEGGVLDEDNLTQIAAGEQVSATVFDNIMKLKQPVGINRLRQLGCIDGSNAVTSRSIAANQLVNIVEEGQGTSE